MDLKVHKGQDGSPVPPFVGLTKPAETDSTTGCPVIIAYALIICAGLWYKSQERLIEETCGVGSSSRGTVSHSCIRPWPRSPPLSRCPLH